MSLRTPLTLILGPLEDLVTYVSAKTIIAFLSSIRVPYGY